ncbi:MAG: glycosyltransferase family 2 protein [Nitrososphaerota archaeon]|nr:glycosyltransferase family 2 protein [Nitrososphaerota archaeon]
MGDELPASDFTVCVCTYNSSPTLRPCLEGVRAALPSARLLVVDHRSSDGTAGIARDFGAEVHFESTGLGYARQLCFDLARTRFVAFVDSDVLLADPRFFRAASDVLGCPRYGAVVGMSAGHRLAYGLPAGLLVLRKADFAAKSIPSYIDARETFFIQRRLSELGLRTVYVADAMVHRSGYRRFKPEWEGANTRLLGGFKEMWYALKVIVLLTFNSHGVRNFLYIPVFYAKFIRGFLDPGRWRRMPRGD